MPKIQVTQELVRVFHENGQKVGVLFKNGVTEFYVLRHATNDHIDRFLNVQTEFIHEDKK